MNKLQDWAKNINLTKEIKRILKYWISDGTIDWREYPNTLRKTATLDKRGLIFIDFRMHFDREYQPSEEFEPDVFGKIYGGFEITHDESEDYIRGGFEWFAHPEKKVMLSLHTLSLEYARPLADCKMVRSMTGADEVDPEMIARVKATGDEVVKYLHQKGSDASRGEIKRALRSFFFVNLPYSKHEEVFGRLIVDRRIKETGRDSSDGRHYALGEMEDAALVDA
ncbi:hypothetical protein [Amorphus orientalis]|uniref:Uncharacterized protein n=1 Tax=Amorphus orientalis TaxID=649198 RepID=A0AAE4AWH6_9HYPH|nr:hypothetical protein [Amorphus orientalis]MDQ0317774.1 hypothetical protein [Amorphus orientalis]